MHFVLSIQNVPGKNKTFVKRHASETTVFGAKAKKTLSYKTSLPGEKKKNISTTLHCEKKVITRYFLILKLFVTTRYHIKLCITF